MIQPILSFLFLSALKTKPATRPAIADLVKQVITVPYPLHGKNNAIVDGANKTITPLIKPIHNPANGPYKQAAIQTGIKVRFIVTPNIGGMMLPIACNATVIAVNMPSALIVFVVRNLFMATIIHFTLIILNIILHLFQKTTHI